MVRRSALPRALVCLVFAVSGFSLAPQSKVAPRHSVSNLPLRFEPNHGQAAPGVLYQARGPGHTLCLTRQEAALAVGDRDNWASARMKWLNANPHPRVRATGPLSGKSNYFIGRDRAAWVRDVAHYGKVEYESVYPGVNLIFYGNARRFEFDFVVAPGADPSRIELAWSGQSSARLNADGDLELLVGAHRFLKKRPVAYQTVRGRRVAVAASYLLSANRVRFKVGPYDRALPLVIDPILSFSTHTGWGESDFPSALAVDAEGNAYMTGSTTSPMAVATPGAAQSSRRGSSDAAVLKLNRDGDAVLYSTFLGGGSSETGFGIAVDRSGSAVVAGWTASTDFPATAGVFQPRSGGGADAFVAKLSPGGDKLIYATYLGGSSSDYAYALALDEEGNATVGGPTYSSNFPLLRPLQDSLKGSPDAFIARLNPDGTGLLFSTYWGGSGAETPYGIAVDSQGATYLTGTTYSEDFPTVNALQKERRGPRDIFVVKLSRGGDQAYYSTYLGGSSDETANAILPDNVGQAYVVGYTRSKDFPVTEGAFQTAHAGYLDGVVFKLSTGGDTLLASTFYGGRYRENLFAIARDPEGNIVATGFTTSPDLPLKEPVSESHQGSGGALGLSHDGGMSWAAGGDSATDSIWMLVSDPADPGILYATVSGNSGGVLRSIDGGVNWAAGAWPEGVTAGVVAVDPSKPTRIYAAGGAGIHLSEDSGATWSRTSVTAAVGALAVDPSNPTTIYAGVGNRLYRSTDSGATWSIPSSNLPGLTINSIAIDPADSQIIYVGSSSYIYKTTNGGANWSSIPYGPSGVYYLALDPSNPRTVYAATISRGLHRSRDAGGTWTQILTTSRRINHVAIHPTRPNTIYAALDIDGVMRTVDGGSIWVSIRDNKLAYPNWIWINPRNPDHLLVGGLINTDVTVVKFNPDLNQILFSTYFGGSANEFGRGLAVDAYGNIYVTGETGGIDFPVTPSAIPPLGSQFLYSGFLFKLAGVP